MPDRLTSQKKKELRDQLYDRDGHECHYCGIEEEDFRKIWGPIFYGAEKRGQVLEIDRKDNGQSYEDIANCVLACALCNMSKSDKFHYDEFKRVGSVIREIWQARQAGVHRGQNQRE